MSNGSAEQSKTDAGVSGDILLETALTQFRARYAGSVLGYLWTVLQPVLFFAVFYAVFTRVIKFGGQVPSYPMLLLMNVALFFFFRESTTGALRSFVGRGSILRSVRVSPLVMPLAAILASIMVLAFYIVVVVIWMLIYGVTPTATWFLFPLLLLYLFALVTGVGLLLAALFVRFRDVGLVWQSLLRLLLFSTPVLFPFELIPGGLFQTVAAMNPLSPLFVQAHTWIIDREAPDWLEVTDGSLQAAAPFVTYVLLCALGVIVFQRERGSLAERL